MLFNKATVFINSSLCNQAVKWTVQRGLCYKVISKKPQRTEVNILPFSCRMHVRVVFYLYTYFNLKKNPALAENSYWSCAAGAALPEAAVPWSSCCTLGMGQPGKTTSADTTQPPGAQPLKWEHPLGNTKYVNNHFFLKKYFPWWFGGIFVCFKKNMHSWYFST